MSRCPVCQTDYIEGQVECCPSCGWDLTPYPPTLGEVPSIFLKKEQFKYACARSLYEKFHGIDMELDGAKRKLTEICREKQSVEAENSRNYQDKGTLEVELNRLKEQLQVKGTLLEKLEDEKQSFETEKLRIYQEKKGLEAELEELEREKLSVETEKYILYEEKEVLEVELNDFKEKLQAKETLLQELESKGRLVEVEKKSRIIAELSDLKEQLEVKETLLKELEGKGQSLEVERKNKIIAEIRDFQAKLKAKETLLADIEEKLSLKDLDTKLRENWKKRKLESNLAFSAFFSLAIVSSIALFSALGITLFKKPEHLQIIIVGGLGITNLVGSGALYLIYRKADREFIYVHAELSFQNFLNENMKYANENISEDKRTEFISMVLRERDKCIQDNRGQNFNRNRSQFKDQQIKDRNN